MTSTASAPAAATGHLHDADEQGQQRQCPAPQQHLTGGAAAGPDGDRPAGGRPASGQSHRVRRNGQQGESERPPPECLRTLRTAVARRRDEVSPSSSPHAPRQALDGLRPHAGVVEAAARPATRSAQVATSRSPRIDAEEPADLVRRHALLERGAATVRRTDAVGDLDRGAERDVDLLRRIEAWSWCAPDATTIDPGANTRAAVRSPRLSARPLDRARGQNATCRLTGELIMAARRSVDSLKVTGPRPLRSTAASRSAHREPRRPGERPPPVDPI